MAITPRTILRNPALMFLITLLIFPAAYFLFSPCQTKTSCSGKYKQTEVAKTRVLKAQKQAEVKQTQPAISNADRGWLGVHIQTLNNHRAEYAGVKLNRGVLVLDAMKHQPGARAGIQDYDVITHINGKSVKTACQLVRQVQATAPGSRVPVKINRDGRNLTVFPTLTKSKIKATGCGAGCK